MQSRRKTQDDWGGGVSRGNQELAAMYRTYVNPADYEMSRDHLELFFAAVRSAGGYNNNPTSLQFMSASNSCLYTRLMVAMEIVYPRTALLF